MFVWLLLLFIELLLRLLLLLLLLFVFLLLWIELFDLLVEWSGKECCRTVLVLLLLLLLLCYIYYAYYCCNADNLSYSLLLGGFILAVELNADELLLLFTELTYEDDEDD